MVQYVNNVECTVLIPPQFFDHSYNPRGLCKLQRRTEFYSRHLSTTKLIDEEWFSY